MAARLLRTCIGTATAGLALAVPVSASGSIYWSVGHAMNSPAADGASAYAYNRLYQIGGSNGSNNIADVVYFRPFSDNTWHNTTSDPFGPRTGQRAAVIDGMIYVVGGEYWSTARQAWVTTNSLERFNPVSSTWKTLAPLPEARGSAAVAATAGKLYVFGGRTSTDWWSGTSTVYSYSPSTNSWKRLADMPTPRLNMSATTADGKIYVAGGYSWSNGRGISASTRGIMFPRASGRLVTYMPYTVENYMARRGGDGRFYYIGGYRDGAVLSTTVIYNATTDTWSTGKAMPAARQESLA